MKAQYVYENMSFERGRDPRHSMGIGNQHHIIHAIENLKDFDTDDRIDLHMVDLLDSGEGKMLEIIAGLYDTKDDMKYLLQNADLWKYFSYSEVYRDAAGKTFYYLLKPKYKELFKGLSILKDFNESVSFKRGRDPKTSMGIGAEAVIRDMLKNLYVNHTANSSNVDKEKDYGLARAMDRAYYYDMPKIVEVCKLIADNPYWMEITKELDVWMEVFDEAVKEGDSEFIDKFLPEIWTKRMSTGQKSKVVEYLLKKVYGT